MAKITVLAGDFLEGDGQLRFGTLVLRTDTHRWAGEAISLKNLELVEASEGNVTENCGAGEVATATRLPNLTAFLAELMRRSPKKSVTFIAWFKDGRKLLASTESDTYTKLQAAIS